ncbi:LPXTG cell wall anchor domain-containing protein, partial [Metabacillus niabensis]|uniref:LPXTG cell wall anchor domain-containing protein n=1 Tax=Metabacillus niabensis TaxID=324854 RepID=UPI00399F242B
GTDPGTDPGTDSGTNPGTDPGTDPGKEIPEDPKTEVPATETPDKEETVTNKPEKEVVTPVQVDQTDRNQEKGGNELPSTATSQYNWLLLGISVLIAGLGFIIFCKKKVVND